MKANESVHLDHLDGGILVYKNNEYGTWITSTKKVFTDADEALAYAGALVKGDEVKAVEKAKAAGAQLPD